MVSHIDSLLRPLVISRTARITYILVLFAVLGGIAAYGLGGLFLGPIVIAALLAVWREWLIDTARWDRLPRLQPNKLITIWNFSFCWPWSLSTAPSRCPRSP